ncbi:MAG: ROK family transcriptional regulator [Cellulomonadaceae bacterium]
MAQRPSMANPGSRDTGSQRALRVRNRDTVLRCLATHGAQSQANLARLTGLSAGTISNIVRDLVEMNRVSRSAAISSGRRSVEISLVADSRVVVGIDVGRTHITMMLCDTAQRMFGLRNRQLALGHEPHSTLAIVSTMLDALLADEGISRDRVVLCTIALSASVEPETGYVVQASSLPHWADIPLVELCTRVLGIPTLVENDANLGALAHTLIDVGAEARTLAYVKVASGIGIGFMFDGEMYTTASGLSGEIGHFQVLGAGDVCYCGHRGCLETVASVRRIIADLNFIRPGNPPTVYDVIARAEQGELAVVRLLEEAGSALGEALAIVCNLLAPDVIVVGGPLTPVAQPMVDAIERSVRRRKLSATKASTTFMLSQFSGEDEVRGACLYALRQLVQAG